MKTTKTNNMLKLNMTTDELTSVLQSIPLSNGEIEMVLERSRYLTDVKENYFEELYIDILAKGLERMRNNKTTIKDFQLYLTQITEIHNLRVEVAERESRWIGTKHNGTLNSVNNL
jgi:hypothetical protein